MEACFFSSRKRKETIAGVLLGLCNGLILVVLGIVLWDAEIWPLCGLLVLFGCAVWVLFLFLYAVLFREYSIDSNGISIRYIKKYCARYSWDDVTAIAVCDLNHATKNEKHCDVVIRISVGEEKKGPLSNGYPIRSSRHQSWRTETYGILHYRDVIQIEYTEQRLEQIRKISKKEILFLLTKVGEERIGHI